MSIQIMKILKSVVESFEKKEKMNLKIINECFKNLNYALNNQFSSLIKKKDAIDEDVRNLQIKIDALQNKIDMIIFLSILNI